MAGKSLRVGRVPAGPEQLDAVPDPAHRAGCPYGREVRVLEEPTVKQLCLEAAKACYEKGGESTVVLGVGKALGIADAFVITSATSSRQVRTIAEAVEERVKALGGGGPISVEGLADARWVLMDFGTFVVHAMLEEARDFYQLDGLWSDSETWEWAPVAASVGGF